MPVARMTNPFVGPMVLRQRARFTPYFQGTWLAPATDTNFVFPQYSQARLPEGPMVLRSNLRNYSPPTPRTWTISGTTRNSVGTALGNCTLHFYTVNSPYIYVGSATSDSSGNYTFNPPGNDGYSADAYKTGSPDVAGRSINGLTVT